MTILVTTTSVFLTMISDTVIKALEKNVTAIPVLVKTKENVFSEIYKKFSSKSPILSRLVYKFSTKVIPQFSTFALVATPKMVEELLKESGVDAIYYNHIRKILVAPSPVTKVEKTYTMLQLYNPQKSTFTTSKWTLKMMGIHTAHKMGLKGTNVKISIIDTGLVIKHPQSSGPMGTRFRHYKTIHPYFISDTTGHGTWCTLLIAGRSASAIIDGVRSTSPPIPASGIAPESDWTAIKALGYVIGVATDADILKSLVLAQGSKIVNASWGITTNESNMTHDALYEPIKKLTESGTIFVAAAGNDGPKTKSIASPGSFPEVLTVGAWDEITGKPANFSSRGPAYKYVKPDVVAPGVNVLNGINGWLSLPYQKIPSRYNVLSGTSMSTPHVAGLLALMTQFYREKLDSEPTTIEIKRMMCEWAKETRFTEPYVKDNSGLEPDPGLSQECLNVKSNVVGYGIPTFDIITWWLETEHAITIS